MRKRESGIWIGDSKDWNRDGDEKVSLSSNCN